MANICVIDQRQCYEGHEVHQTSCRCLPSEKTPIARQAACRQYRTVSAYVSAMVRVDVVVQSQRRLQLS